MTFSISFLSNYICPLDTADPNPYFGKIVEEDAESGLYLLESYSLTRDFQGYILLAIEDLQAYRIFKGKEESNDWIAANFIA